ncbi:3503_t:CDS:2, partial [Funneliformis geosporum]
IDYNYIKNAHFHQQTEERFLEIARQNSKIRKERLAAEYGLAKSGPFKILKLDRHLQTPHDAYHSMAGKAHTLLEATFNVFNTNGENSFIKYWKQIEKPTYWLAMIIPFILRCFLKPYHIKAETLNNWLITFGIRQNSAISKLCMCWAIEAKVLKLVFSITMTENIYQKLQEYLKREHDMLIQ